MIINFANFKMCFHTELWRYYISHIWSRLSCKTHNENCLRISGKGQRTVSSCTGQVPGQQQPSAQCKWTGREGWRQADQHDRVAIHPAWSRSWHVLSFWHLQGAGGRLWCPLSSSWACTGALIATLLLGQGSFSLQTVCEGSCALSSA